MPKILQLLTPLLLASSMSCTYQAAKKRETANIAKQKHQHNLEQIGHSAHLHDQENLLLESQRNRREVNKLKNELGFLEAQTATSKEQQKRAQEIRILLKKLQKI